MAKLWTIAQAADYLSIHPDTLRRWTDRGLVPHVRLPSGYRRYDPAELAQLKEEWSRRGGVEEDDEETLEGSRGRVVA